MVKRSKLKNKLKGVLGRKKNGRKGSTSPKKGKSSSAKKAEKPTPTSPTPPKKKEPKPENTIPHINEKIHETCYSGTLLELTAYLKMTRWVPNFVRPGWDGTSALHMCAYRADPGMAKLLLKKGWDPNFKDKNGECPIHYIVKNNGRADLKEARDKRKMQVRVLNKYKIEFKKLQEQHSWSLASVASKREKRLRFAEERLTIKQKQSWKFRKERALEELQRTSKFYVNTDGNKQKNESKKKKSYGIRKKSKRKSDDDSDDEFNEPVVEIDAAAYLKESLAKSAAAESKEAPSDLLENGNQETDEGESEENKKIEEGKRREACHARALKIGKQMFDRILDNAFIEEAKKRLLRDFERQEEEKLQKGMADLQVTIDEEITKQLNDSQSVHRTRSFELKRNIKMAKQAIKQSDEAGVNYSLLTIRALLESGGQVHAPGLFNVTALQYSEMLGKPEISKFLRFEAKRIDVKMGKESDIGRWKRLEALKTANKKRLVEKRRLLEKQRRERQQIAEEKLQEQMKLIATDYDPVAGNKVLSEKALAKEAKGLMAAAKPVERSKVTGLEIKQKQMRGSATVVRRSAKK